MAVYEQTYKPYQGTRTPEWSRFLIVPSYAFRSVFDSKFFTAFFALCFAYPLIASVLIYLHHNVNALAIFKLNLRELVPIDRSFFLAFVAVQCSGFGSLLTLFVGPSLVSRDLANNALPLYLSRPFSRAEYVIGKMSVIVILLSLVTWVPGLLLFLFQSYLEGGGWMLRNLFIARAITVGSLVWILLLALMTLTVSAWVKWRMAASAVLLGLFFVPTALSEVINELFETRLGKLISFGELMNAVWQGLFGSHDRQPSTSQFEENGRVVREITFIDPPLWCSWAALSVICALLLLMLMRKVKAYEVVS